MCLPSTVYISFHQNETIHYTHNPLNNSNSPHSLRHLHLRARFFCSILFVEYVRLTSGNVQKNIQRAPNYKEDIFELRMAKQNSDVLSWQPYIFRYWLIEIHSTIIINYIF